MGVRYFCDRCDKEFNSSGLLIPIYARDAFGTKLTHIDDGLLCKECVEKFNVVKDHLKYEEDFFNMTDKDIALIEYKFNVGDRVITSTGQVGIIKDICDCDRCKERGFYEPRVETLVGADKIYITDNDKRVNFKSFYEIGKYKFGNIDKDSIEYSIESETCNIKESAKRLKEYKKQLCYIEELESKKEG